MEISEIVKMLRDKAAELQKFFKIVDRPEVIYADSFQFVRALEAAADVLSVENDREKIVVQLRKQWQDAEMFICTMCGHFDRKADGNVVYGNRDCGELVGFPYCRKFTPWIPVSVRLPEDGETVLVYGSKGGIYTAYCNRRYKNVGWHKLNSKSHYCNPTHWMPLPEPPEEASK